MRVVIHGRRSRSGSVMVMVAVALTALMGIAALVIDIGLLYVAKQNAENTADECAVSALAAVNNYVDAGIEEELEAPNEVAKVSGYAMAAYPPMASGDGSIRSASIASFFGVGLNHHIRSTIAPIWDFEVHGGEQFDVSVNVACQIPVDMTFARVFGITRETVQANAVARLYSVPYLEYAFAPWAVTKSTIFPAGGGGIQVGVGQTWTLANPGSAATEMNPNEFTAIAIPGAFDYPSQLQGPGATVRLIPDLPAEPPGTLVQPSYISPLQMQSDFNGTTSSKLAARFGVTDAGVDDGAYSNWSNAGQESGSYPASNRILMVPIVDDNAGAGGFRVRGFAPVFVTSFDKTAGKVHFVLLSATWTGGKLRWNMKPKPVDTTSTVSKITLFDHGTTLTLD